MNSIVIEQTKEEMAQAFEVQRNASICAVRLARGKVSSLSLDEASKEAINIKFSMKPRSVQAPRGILRVEVDFRAVGDVEVRSVDKKPAKKETPVSVECTFAVDYELQEGFQPSAMQVKAFRDGNVIFNCWPYFREYLQDSVQRMGFPPLIAPFLRVLSRPPAATKERSKTRPG
jgi:preprotein translocase subunit SecB